MYHMKKINIFEFDSYKMYMRAKIGAYPKGGHGQLKKIAQFSRVHTTLLSQVLNGPRDLSPEQSCIVAAYFQLTQLETDFFLALVELERSGSERLRAVIARRLSDLRKRSRDLKDRLPRAHSLKEEDKYVFYSNWFFSGIRLLSSVPGFQSRAKAAKHFNLPPVLVDQIVDFLVARGLCVEDDGVLKMGPSRIHLEASSPLIGRHHLNWRMKAIERHGKLGDDELMFSGPMSVSKEGARRIREKLVQVIEEALAIVDKEDPEKLACLNIDWFGF